MNKCPKCKRPTSELYPIDDERYTDGVCIWCLFSIDQARKYLAEKEG